MNNLEKNKKEKGDKAGEREVEEQVLKGLKRTLGEEHPYTLTSLLNLASSL